MVVIEPMPVPLLQSRHISRHCRQRRALPPGRCKLGLQLSLCLYRRCPLILQPPQLTRKLLLRVLARGRGGDGCGLLLVMETRCVLLSCGVFTCAQMWV